MTFQQLEYIVEISKCGSINKAAQKLFLSQSGISTAVRELENELGIRVLARSNRGVEFTPEGKEFLSYAVSLLEQKRGIESLYGEARNAAAPVRFSVSCQRYPFAVDAFLRLLRIAGENRFRFGLRETGMDGVIDDVYDHRADVADDAHVRPGAGIPRTGRRLPLYLCSRGASAGWPLQRNGGGTGRISVCGV